MSQGIRGTWTKGATAAALGATLLAVLACGKTGGAPPREGGELPLGGIKLGAPVLDLRDPDVVAARTEELEGAQFVAPRLSAAPRTAREQASAVIRALSARLGRCTLEGTGVDPVRPDGKFMFWVRGWVNANTVGNAWGFTTSVTANPVDEAKWMASFVPSQALYECTRLQTPTELPLHGGDDHIAALIPQLNKRLKDCSLRPTGTIGEPDTEGNFRFYLEAVYPDGRVEPKIHFETSVRNVVATDVEDFLKLIPSQAFKSCKHNTDPDPDPDPEPDPDPTPDAAALRRHVQSILFFTNDRLAECVIYQEGDVGAVDAEGFAEFRANARYADGTVDKTQKFRASLKVPVEQSMQELLGVVPSQTFTKCKIRDQDGGNPDPTPDVTRPFVANALKVANASYSNCTLAISGRTGAVDAHGDFDFYLTAFWQDDGSFLNPTRFRANVFQTPEATAQVLVRLIPAVEFKSCKLR